MIQDVEPIVRRAHEVGAHVILDCYQSAGIVPVDVTALGVDFAVGGSVKWLCGGPGNGWLYVRPDLGETLEPTYIGWQAHARPFAFEEELEYADGAARFLTGTPNPAAHYGRQPPATTSSRRSALTRIRENSLRQTQLLIDLADAAGFEVQLDARPEPAWWRGHRERAGGGCRVRRARAARDPRRLPSRRRDPHRPALLHGGRRDPLRGRADRGDPRDRRVRAPRAASLR